MTQIIIHVDMDAFYASVEVRDNPSLAGKPLIIGSLPTERGVVATCSYEARKFGVHSAMNIKEAYRLCPNGVYMHPNFEKYRAESEKLHRIWNDYASASEYIALDEAYLDVTGTAGSVVKARVFAQEIKRRVREEQHLSCSVGLAYSKTAARLYLAYPKEKELIIVHYKIYEWEYGNKLNIQSPVSSIQNLFYVKKINQIFISDEQAKYIYGFDIDDGKKKLCLKRGTNPGFITSIALLNDGKFLAVNNLDRTIHIFDLDIKNNAFSLKNMFLGIFSDMVEIYPRLRIYYQNILENMEGLFFQNNFAKKGAVLFSDNDDELIIIAYNGFAFKIKINFKELSYKVVLKEEYVEKKLKNMSLYNSGLEGSDK